MADQTENTLDWLVGLFRTGDADAASKLADRDLSRDQMRDLKNGLDEQSALNPDSGLGSWTDRVFEQVGYQGGYSRSEVGQALSQSPAPLTATSPPPVTTPDYYLDSTANYDPTPDTAGGAFEPSDPTWNDTRPEASAAASGTEAGSSEIDAYRQGLMDYAGKGALADYQQRYPDDWMEQLEAAYGDNYEQYWMREDPEGFERWKTEERAGDDGDEPGSDRPPNVTDATRAEDNRLLDDQTADLERDPTSQAISERISELDAAFTAEPRSVAAADATDAELDELSDPAAGQSGSVADPEPSWDTDPVGRATTSSTVGVTPDEAGGADSEPDDGDAPDEPPGGDDVGEHDLPM